MIFVRDKGRMCNNILQYGHVYAWGREHGIKTMSMRFAYKYQYFNICHTRYHWFWLYIVAKYAAKFKIIATVAFHEQQNEETQSLRLLQNKEKTIMAEGWHVRFYDLFLKYKDEILNLFAFDRKIADSIGKQIKQTSEDTDIRLGLHIRRGDYKTWHGGRYYFSDDVYISYIKHFVNEHKDSRTVIYICGNDPSLNKEYYRRSLPDCEIFFPDGNPAEDLCLLSECDYIIGAPSTFSLVASMYRDTPLCWMEESDATTMAFDHFDNLFRNIR